MSAPPPPATEHSWGPRPWLRPVLVVALVAAVAWLIFDPNAENQLVAAVLAVVCLVVTLLLIRVQVRLRTSADGIVVRSVAATRRWAWADVVSIATPHRGRFGRRGATLEIEVGGEPEDPEATLLVFSAFELGDDPAAVGRVLERIRRSAPS